MIIYINIVISKWYLLLFLGSNLIVEFLDVMNILIYVFNVSE